MEEGASLRIGVEVVENVAMRSGNESVNE